MKIKNKCLFIAVFVISVLISAKETPKKNNLYQFAGRIEHLEDGGTLLIGSASSVTFEFTDLSCEIYLKSVDKNYEHHNYVVLELDGEYLGRFTIKKGGLKTFPIQVTKLQPMHRLTIFKATEAANGSVLFTGTNAHLTKIKQPKKKKVEFIGDSITCGYGNDATSIPCGKGEWYDQHNAYMAYGPQLARMLDFDYVLSSVSGIGMYRNWNDEHENEAIMPDVYENLYLNKDYGKPYDFAFQPDLVSICLGTNDLSDGDGKKKRLPFNENKYVSNYIDFIKTVYLHAPKTRIILLTSPMVSGTKNDVLLRCLNRVITAFAADKNHQPIQLFEFEPMRPNGCGYHPDMIDDTVMANQLQPFFKELLDEN
ncbi:SGNH/GDSL hydrolase family protein [Flavobacterium agrisoli]|uniref:GDSL family lipase n=1 Tax=Flavobacterium agrisoli TaxID=2793066 RepID=A0A934PLQ3_9FLAO|nr:SGNH/GDSL hydrolase family protein [Flavobacterium agrisoli]MBK0369110.1 GDSL family lipase [Flavobacterium agrisoli]